MAANDRAAQADSPAKSRPQASAAPGSVLTVGLAVLLAWQMMVVIDGTIVTIALPDIRTSLHFSEDGLSWVVNAYSLVFGGLVLLGSRAGDALGRRRMMVTGVLVFTAASAMGFFAASPEMLIAGRVIQGLGAAMAAPSTLSLITTNFAEGPVRDRALALSAAVAGLGGSLGLILGGVLTSWLSWHWIFFVNVPIGLTVAFLAPRVVRESPRIPGKLDIGGAAASTLGVTVLVFGFIRASDFGWTNVRTIGSFLAAIVLLAAFVVIERRSDHPLIPGRLLADRDRVVGLGLMLLVPIVMFGTFYFLSNYLQDLLKMSAIRAGFAFLPFSGVVVACSKFVPDTARKLGPRIVIAAGSLCMILGALVLSQLDDSSSYWLIVLPGMVLTAAGVAMNYVSLNLLILGTVAADDSGIASGLIQTMQQVGSAIGVGLLVSVFAARERAALRKGVDAALAVIDGLQAGFIAAAIVSAVVMVVALIAIRRKVVVGNAPVIV
ncbi:MAG: MFS transporter [Thermomicrobiales bacterium]